MKVGLVGAGRIGTFHAGTLVNDRRVSDLRITDADPARAELLASSLGAAVSPDAESLVAWADALVIAATTDAHASLIELGATGGLPTFCEKPISLDLQTTDRVLARVAAAGIPLQIGFQRRFDRGYAEMRRLVQSGSLGTLYAPCHARPRTPSRGLSEVLWRAFCRPDDSRLRHPALDDGPGDRPRLCHRVGAHRRPGV